MTINLWAKDLLNVWLLPVYIINISFHDQSSPFGRIYGISFLTFSLTYFLAYILTFFLAVFLACYLASILTSYLASFHAFILAVYLIYSHILSGIYFDIFSCTYYVLTFWHSDILSGMCSGPGVDTSGDGNKDFGAEARRNKGQGMECRDPHLAGGKKKPPAAPAWSRSMRTRRPLLTCQRPWTACNSRGSCGSRCNVSLRKTGRIID